MLPPHPAAMLAVIAYNADVGRTILYGLLIGLPTASLAGPVFAAWVAPRIVLPADNPIARQLEGSSDGSDGSGALQQTPSFGISLFTVLIPVILMLLASMGDLALDSTSSVRS